ERLVRRVAVEREVERFGARGRGGQDRARRGAARRPARGPGLGGDIVVAARKRRVGLLEIEGIGRGCGGSCGLRRLLGGLGEEVERVVRGIGRARRRRGGGGGGAGGGA